MSSTASTNQSIAVSSFKYRVLDARLSGSTIEKMYSELQNPSIDDIDLLTSKVYEYLSPLLNDERNRYKYQIDQQNNYSLPPINLKELYYRQKKEFFNPYYFDYISKLLWNIIHQKDDKTFKLRYWLTSMQYISEGSFGKVFSSKLNLNTRNNELGPIVSIKRALNPNYSILHEYVVGHKLNNLRKQKMSSGFVYTYAMINCSPEVHIKDQVKAFCANTDENSLDETEFIITEYVDNLFTLTEYLSSTDFTWDSLFSILLTVFADLNVANEQLEYNHWDLHTSNILLRPVAEYEEGIANISKHKEIDLYIKTDYIPTIIDHGMASIKLAGKIIGPDYLANTSCYFDGRLFPLADVYRLVASCFTNLLVIQRTPERTTALYKLYIMMTKLIDFGADEMELFIKLDPDTYSREEIDYFYNTYNFAKVNVREINKSILTFIFELRELDIDMFEDLVTIEAPNPLNDVCLGRCTKLEGDNAVLDLFKADLYNISLADLQYKSIPSITFLRFKDMLDIKIEMLNLATKNLKYYVIEIDKIINFYLEFNDLAYYSSVFKRYKPLFERKDSKLVRQISAVFDSARNKPYTALTILINMLESDEFIPAEDNSYMENKNATLILLKDLINNYK